MREKLLLALLTCGIIAVASAAAADEIIGRASVVDGDTIEIHGKRIRLDGIDAPESSQVCTDSKGLKYRCGKTAADALDKKLIGKTVQCVLSGYDRYGRALATCAVQGENINQWLVREGYALAFRKYSSAYVPDEDAARAAKKGLWSGTFEAPWEYRRHRSQRPRNHGSSIETLRTVLASTNEHTPARSRAP